MVNVKSEVTGSVWKLMSAQGQSVSSGDVLLVIESMKMEIPVEAPASGVLRELRVTEGQVIAEGDVVAVIGAPTA